MIEMIERVARAIMDADGDPKGCEVMDYQRTRARAAIEAMREPIKEMVPDTVYDVDAMIDAALTEAVSSPAFGPTILEAQRSLR